MKRIRLMLHFARLELHSLWLHMTSQPDLIYIAPMMVITGFFMPWVFKFLALVIGPLMVGLGTVMLLVAVGQKVQRFISKGVRHYD